MKKLKIMYFVGFFMGLAGAPLVLADLIINGSNWVLLSYVPYVLYAAGLSIMVIAVILKQRRCGSPDKGRDLNDKQ